MRPFIFQGRPVYVQLGYYTEPLALIPIHIWGKGQMQCHFKILNHRSTAESQVLFDLLGRKEVESADHFSKASLLSFFSKLFFKLRLNSHA
jgi:hypothetical protein